MTPETVLWRGCSGKTPSVVVCDSGASQWPGYATVGRQFVLLLPAVFYDKILRSALHTERHTRSKLAASVSVCQPRWLLGVLYPWNTSGHIRMWNDLFTVRTHYNAIVLPYWEVWPPASTMTTQSHYPDTQLTTPCAILLMSDARLGHHKYQFDKSLLWLTYIYTYTPGRPTRYMCVYIHIYIHICTHIQIYMYIHIQVHTYTYRRMNLHPLINHSGTQLTIICVYT